MSYSLSMTLFYFFLYSFLGWSIEVACATIKNKHLINKGFLNLPFSLPYGFSVILLMTFYQFLPKSFILQLIVSFAVFHVVWTFSEFFIQKICGLPEIETSNLPTLTWKSQLIFESAASGIIATFLCTVHPFLHLLMRTIPNFIIVMISLILTIFLCLDFVCVLFTLKTHKLPSNSDFIKENTQYLTSKINAAIWNRLTKSYPELQTPSQSENTVFAKGLCFDKLIWIFLISSFLGAIIEMCFCRIAGDPWMNRSSLLYGPFSVVWGLGAVLLTITLRPFSSKPWLVLFCGFIIGGVYEYFCSIFTELIFGTVFWDYSHMSTSVGGRTNLLYCFFWGFLSVVWIRVFFPYLEKIIESIPPLYGKLITWMIVFFMVFNSLLTSAAMIRYTSRQTQPFPENMIESFLDTNYDDTWMEHRWPNMQKTSNPEI